MDSKDSVWEQEYLSHSVLDVSNYCEDSADFEVLTRNDFVGADSSEVEQGEVDSLSRTRLDDPRTLFRSCKHGKVVCL